MSIENITDSYGMQDIKEGTWLSIFDGRDFYRVNIDEHNAYTVYDFENNKVRDEETSKEMIIEAIKYLKETSNAS